MTFESRPAEGNGAKHVDISRKSIQAETQLVHKPWGRGVHYTSTLGKQGAQPVEQKREEQIRMVGDGGSKLYSVLKGHKTLTLRIRRLALGKFWPVHDLIYFNSLCLIVVLRRDYHGGARGKGGSREIVLINQADDPDVLNQGWVEE